MVSLPYFSLDPIMILTVVLTGITTDCPHFLGETGDEYAKDMKKVLYNNEISGKTREIISRGDRSGPSI